MYLLATFLLIFLLFDVLLGTRLYVPLSQEVGDTSCDCEAPYRSLDGSCNNLKNPDWGTPNSEFIRLFNCTSYADGKNKIPDLPSARKISEKAFPDVYDLDPEGTVCLTMWGQFIAHDIAFLLDEIADQPITCPCKFGKLTDTLVDSDRCAPIKIPPDDPFYGPVGKECIDFPRTFSTYQKDPSKRAEPINSVTQYLDGSPLYGNSVEESNSLRRFKHGMLDYQTRKKRMYPPQADDECRDIGASDNLCLKTGDDRANQNIHLSLLHIILMRLHNDIAKVLCTEINSHWEDEQCFQEARRIVIAFIQHISVHEFLPCIIGKDNVFGKIINTSHTFDNNYDPCCTVATGNEFSTAAYRQFHNLIVGWIQLFTQTRQEQYALRLSDHLGNPSSLLKKNIELYLATGAVTQHVMKSDAYYHDEITKYFFRPINGTHGVDLAAIDIQRGRDHGLAYYKDALEKCGLGKIKRWDDYKKYIPPKVVDNVLKNIYCDYKDVELYVGGALEVHIPGTLSGPTFNCIMVEQFERLKKCDRYWYTYENQPHPFTKDQLKSIKKGATISSLLCRYISGFESVQRRGFEVVSDSNPLVCCDDIPFINLELWKD